MDQALLWKLLAGAVALAGLLAGAVVWAVARVIKSRAAVEEQIERRLNIAKSELMERVSATLSAGASDLAARARELTARMEEVLSQSDLARRGVADNLETRIEAKLTLLESRLAESFEASIARVHSEHLGNLLAEARRVFENFDYLRYGLDQVRETLAASTGPEAQAAGAAVQALAERMDQQQAVFSRALDDFHAKNAGLGEEMKLFTASLSGLQEDLAAVRKHLANLSNQSETLKNLLSSAIQKMTMMKVSNF
jgi:chromosome segregation ATPase